MIKMDEKDLDQELRNLAERALPGLPNTFKAGLWKSIRAESSPGPERWVEDPDLPLVRALQAGQDQAFETLVDRHEAGLYRFVFRHCSDETDAIQLTHDTFVRAYLNIGKFRPKAKFVTWLYHIALNLCRDYARRHPPRESLQSASLSAEVTQVIAPNDSLTTRRAPDTEAHAREKVRALEMAIAELPPELKSSLILTALEGCSYARSGELLGITGKAVEMKVYRARKILLCFYISGADPGGSNPLFGSCRLYSPARRPSTASRIAAGRDANSSF
jgi:RNA polymerase sigma factor (sigma-70 family)